MTPDYFVYELKSHTGRTIYVGVSGDPERRVAQHRRVQPWADEIAYWRVVRRFGNRQDALAFEAQRIAAVQPRHNRKHASHAEALASRTGGRPQGHRLSVAAWDDLLRIKGDSLTAVAASAGVMRATVSGLVTGRSRASVPMAHKLAAALGCNPETLFPTLRASTYCEVAA